MTILIREETAADYSAIETLTIAAFAEMPYSQQTEHHIIRALRSSDQLTLSLVAEQAGEVIGHIAVSPIILSDGSSGWFGIGPLAVKPEHQQQGIGSKLIEAAISTLTQQQAAGLVLVGDPAYYNRFGFYASSQLLYPNIPAEYMLVHPLQGEIPEATVQFQPAFQTTA
ncbi:MAG: N-acetyltransferase [Marinobacterium sp.]|nr:N-acetyltransferase [Marinobacterium sp.]